MRQKICHLPYIQHNTLLLIFRGEVFMKKLFAIIFVFSMVFFAACGDDSNDKSKRNEQNANDEETTETTDDSDETDTGSTDADSSDCTGISVEWDTFFQNEDSYYLASVEPWVDNGINSWLTMMFYNKAYFLITPDTGTYDLGAERNKNFGTCSECIIAETEIQSEDGNYIKYFLPEKGTLKIDATDSKGNIKGSVSARFIEVILDYEYFPGESFTVEDGDCLEMETASFDSGCEEPCVPQCDGKECGSNGCGGTCGSCEGQACGEDFKCVPLQCDPQCEDKICGYNGCGGTCGEGCGRDKACSADQKSCVDFKCTEITLGEGTYDYIYKTYDMSYTPNTQPDDIVSFVLNTCETGTYDLYGKTQETSDLYFVAYEDYESGKGYNKLYYQQQGNVKLTISENDETTNVKAEISGLRLEEINLDNNKNPFVVPGGACYDVKDTTVTYTIE